MTLGEKLSKLRKENNYTQEQLANVLGVSRQAISKWESNITYPETEKLIRMSKLFHCTTDYLLLEEEETTKNTEPNNSHPASPNNRIFIESPLTKSLVSCFKVTASPVIAPTKDQPKYLLLGVDKVTVLGEHTTQLGWYATEEDIQREISEISSAIRNGESSYTIKYNVEVDTKLFNVLMKKTQTEELTDHPLKRVMRGRKSKKTVCGMPLWHIGKNAKGFIAVGLNARGIIAIGLKATGIVSLGMLSIGLLSIGVFALGILSAACFSIGVFATGAISLGIISLGAIAVGNFSIGALAIGKYFALGDNARAMIAVGDTEATGSVFQRIGKLTAEDVSTLKALLDTTVPSYLSWAKEIIKTLL